MATEHDYFDAYVAAETAAVHFGVMVLGYLAAADDEQEESA